MVTAGTNLPLAFFHVSQMPPEICGFTTQLSKFKAFPRAPNENWAPRGFQRSTGRQSWLEGELTPEPGPGSASALGAVRARGRSSWAPRGVDPSAGPALGAELPPAPLLGWHRDSLAQGFLQCRRTRLNPWLGKVCWRKKWLPPPVFLPGEFHGHRSLASYSPWGQKSRTGLSL